jgi:anti-sigma-K factor RskA
MTDHEHIDELAAEYVLGTLTADERSSVDVQRASNADLNSAIAAWERRLSPFLDAVEPVSPPAHLYDKIQARLSPASNVVSMQAFQDKLAARAGRWRAATMAMTAVAASLAGVLVWREAYKPPMSETFVAVLQAEQQTPAFLMTIDTKSHMCAIKAVAAPKMPDKNYELWMVHDSLGQPKSMGLIGKSGEMDVMAMSEDTDMDLYMNATFAVSLEPEGGSPTGQPSGPVMYVGKLVRSMPDARSL